MSGEAPRRLGRPPRAENQRERILGQAAILFGSSGFDAASLNDLAAEVGISKAGLYHYFKTKQEVFDAIILETLEALLLEVSAAVARAPDPSARLLAFMLAHAEFFERHYWAFRCMLVSYSAMADPMLLHEAVALRERYESVLRAIIAEGVSHGQFRAVDPASTGRAVLSLLNWMARWFKPGGPRTAPDIAREYTDLLINGITNGITA